MKKLMLALSVVAFSLFAGEIRMLGLAVEADSAVSVTGSQAQDIVTALSGGFTLNGVEYTVTNHPLITVVDAYARAAAAFAYSPTNMPGLGTDTVARASSITINGDTQYATNNPTFTITASGIGAQPAGPVVAIWGTNGTEFCTLEDGNVLTQWRAVEDFMWMGWSNQTPNVKSIIIGLPDFPIYYDENPFLDLPWSTAESNLYGYVSASFEQVIWRCFDQQLVSQDAPSYGFVTDTHTVEYMSVILTNLVSRNLDLDDLASITGRLTAVEGVAATKLDQTGGTASNLTVNGTLNGAPYVPLFIGTTNVLPLVANRTNGVLYVEIP